MLGNDTQGRTIRMFLVDGNVSGIVTAEIMNWTGHVVIGPRSKLADLLVRDEVGKTGVYFLIGHDPESGDLSVYVGESDDVGKRLKDHAKDPKKDFWETVCFVTSKDQNLTKAHGRYIESRLIDIATNAGRANILNATNPESTGLPEADTSDMEYFIQQIGLIMPALGMEFLRAKPPVVKNGNTINVEYEISYEKQGVMAKAIERDNEFIVLKNSKVRPSWVGEGSKNTTYARLYAEAVASSKIKVRADGYAVLIEDIPFKSPSGAAAVVLGRSANGRTEWKVKGSDKTYADWQNDKLDEVGNRNFRS